jgi:hypothetical protein
MNTRTAPTKSLEEVTAFVLGCHEERMDSRWPFMALPDDVAAEAKAEGRLVQVRRVNVHDN